MTDVVPLNFKATTAGTYLISIDHVDGLFSGSQDVYLRDNVLGTTHDLKAAAYRFASESGIASNRFEVVYQMPLAVHAPLFNENAVVVYKQNGNFVINCGLSL